LLRSKERPAALDHGIIHLFLYTGRYHDERKFTLQIVFVFQPDRTQFRDLPSLLRAEEIEQSPHLSFFPRSQFASIAAFCRQNSPQVTWPRCTCPACNLDRASSRTPQLTADALNMPAICAGQVLINTITEKVGTSFSHLTYGELLANPQRSRASVQTDSCQGVCLHLETSIGQDSCEPHDGRESH